ncbi:MAG: PHP-associated domain-containing protein [Dehalococcoidia bacterium]
MPLAREMRGTIVDMHVHTVRGAADSSLTLEELTREAHRVGLGGVVISEHDRCWDRREVEEFSHSSGLLVVRGMEVSTDLGHIIALGLEGYVPGIHRAAELRRVVDEVGGFMIAAHPFRHFLDPAPHRRDGRRPLSLNPEAIVGLPIFQVVDEVEVANGGTSPQENYLALLAARILGKSGIGASDAHSGHGLGCFATAFEAQLEDEGHLIAELRAGRYRPVEGLLSGGITAYGEGVVDVDLSLLRAE